MTMSFAKAFTLIVGRHLNCCFYWMLKLGYCLYDSL
jgi:hypothetical protein